MDVADADALQQVVHHAGVVVAVATPQYALVRLAEVTGYANATTGTPRETRRD